MRFQSYTVFYCVLNANYLYFHLYSKQNNSSIFASSQKCFSIETSILSPLIVNVSQLTDALVDVVVASLQVLRKLHLAIDPVGLWFKFRRQCTLPLVLILYRIVHVLLQLSLIVLRRIIEVTQSVMLYKVLVAWGNAIETRNEQLV